MKRANVHSIQQSASLGIGMDVIIIATNTPAQEVYWKKRLEATRGQIIKKNALIFTVYEDWPGGAGNALGTLYAYQLADQKLRKKDGLSLYDLQRFGSSIAIYHTAGKGTRLSPLTGSEHNNKSAVKLPSLVKVDDKLTSMTLLEAVIRQTALFDQACKGRLSVFWGDQIFIPSKRYPEESFSHANILFQRMAMPSQAQWEKKQLSSYGFIFIDQEQRTKQAEKLDYQTFCRLATHQFGSSLGSFSLSIELLEALTQEFYTELFKRKRPFNSDLDWWMPLSLKKQTFLSIIDKKDLPRKSALKHYERMNLFKEDFLNEFKKSKPLLSAFDIGTNSYWWDFGTVKNYMNNHMRLLDNDEEAEIMRLFFSTEHKTIKCCEKDSIILSSNVKAKYKRSIIIESEVQSGNIENSLIIKSQINEVQANTSLIYQAIDQKNLVIKGGKVRADIHLSGNASPIPMQTHLERNGHEDWKKCLTPNTHSFEEIYTLQSSP